MLVCVCICNNHLSDLHFTMDRSHFIDLCVYGTVSLSVFNQIINFHTTRDKDTLKVIDRLIDSVRR